MMATEMREKLDEIINDQGDFKVYYRDQLEPEYRIEATGVVFEAERDAILLQSDED